MKKLWLIAFLFSIVRAYSLPNTVSSDSVAPISILTWNVKLLPRGAVFLHHHPVKRAKLIPQKLLEQSADVVVLQEAFDGKAVRIIKRRLQKEYPFVAGMKNRKVMSYKRAGGVLMFSKYPMHEIESIRYSNCKGVDCLGNKGAMLVEVQHPLKNFQLLGTHMQAGGTKELKISQYDEAGGLMKRHEQNAEPQFASGDFNTHKDDTYLYPILLNKLGAEDGDICSELKCTSDHLLNDMDTYDPKRRRVIDYVFYRGNGVKPVSVSRSVVRFQQQWNKQHKDLSDHFALLLQIKL